MTSAALSTDALREIKARRDSLSLEHSREVDDEARRQKRLEGARGVQAFMTWFKKQREAQGMVMASNHMLDVQKVTSETFSVGLLDMRYYIAIPEDCRDWFFEMPWLHVALGRDSSLMSLVCARSRVPDVKLPEFALNFDTGMPAMMKMMSNYHYLDVRLITGKPTPTPGGSRVDVSRDVFMTLDIRVIAGERTFTALLDGRRANGMDINSITHGSRPSRLVKNSPPRAP